MKLLAATLVVIAGLFFAPAALAGHHQPPTVLTGSNGDAPACEIPVGANPKYHPCVACDPDPPHGGDPRWHPPCPVPEPCSYERSK